MHCPAARPVTPAPGMRLTGVRGATGPSPATRNVSGRRHVRVTVGDAVGRAIAAGARAVTDPTMLAFGERVARVRDPQGHPWWLHERVEDVTPGELARRFADPAAERGAGRGNGHRSTIMVWERIVGRGKQMPQPRGQAMNGLISRLIYPAPVGRLTSGRSSEPWNPEKNLCGGRRPVTNASG